MKSFSLRTLVRGGLLYLAAVSILFAWTTVSSAPAAGPTFLSSSDILLRRSGHTRLIIRSDSPTGDGVMLQVLTGTPGTTTRFSVDEDGDTVVGNSITFGGTTMTASTARINSALDGIGATVTPANLATLTNGSNADALHDHAVGSISSGLVMIWTGGALPTGWSLLDGVSASPNLVGRFLVGVNPGTTSIGDTGGSNTVTLATANLPSHNHSVTSDAGTHSHSGLTDSAGSHSHTGGINFSEGADFESVGIVTNYELSTNGGLWGTHSHSVSSVSTQSHNHTHATSTMNSTGSGAAFDNKPRNYEVKFMIKD
jgi:microcystin-dependent protein